MIMTSTLVWYGCKKENENADPQSVNENTNLKTGKTNRQGARIVAKLVSGQVVLEMSEQQIKSKTLNTYLKDSTHLKIDSIRIHFMNPDPAGGTAGGAWCLHEYGSSTSNPDLVFQMYIPLELDSADFTFAVSGTSSPRPVNRCFSYCPLFITQGGQLYKRMCYCGSLVGNASHVEDCGHVYDCGTSLPGCSGCHYHSRPCTFATLITTDLGGVDYCFFGQQEKIPW